MRRMLVVPLVAAVFGACQCNKEQGTTFAGPEAAVLDPTAMDGDVYLLDFGRVRAGFVYEKSILVENRGRTAWNVSSAALRTGSAATFEVKGPEMPHAVDIGERMELKVTYAPLSAESALGWVDIDGDDPKLQKIVVRVTAIAEAPGIVVCVKATNPAGPLKCDTDQEVAGRLLVDFGIIRLVDPASVRTLVIRNTSTVDMNIASVVRADGTSPEFTIGGLPSNSVPGGGEIEVVLSYKPFDGGYDEGQLEITADDPKRPLVRVDLKGGGLAPKLCPKCGGDVCTELDFGSVVQNGVADKEVEFESCGTTPVELQGLTVATGAEFSLPQPPSMPVQMAPKVSMKVRVRYSPLNLGPDTGRLNVLSDDPASGYITLKGNGVTEPTCDLALSKRTVNFGSVPTTGFADQALVGTNNGQRACSVTAITGPTGSTAFTIRSAPGTPFVVLPGEFFTVSLRYTPTGATTETATLTIESNDSAEPQIPVTLTGQGKAPGKCEPVVTPASIAFGAVPVGIAKTAGISVYNFGTDMCFVTGIDLAQNGSKAFSLSRLPMIPSFLDSGGKLDVEVKFAPLTGGNHANTVTIKAGESLFSTKSYLVPLSGSAGDPAICISPVPPILDFGPQAAGTSRDMGFTIQSCGAGTLELRGIDIDAGTSPEFKIIQKPPVPLALTPGNSSTVQVRYAPTTSGPDYGRILVLNNDPRIPAAPVVLKGNAAGCFTSVLNCTPTSLAFPKTPVGLTSSLVFTCVSLGTNPVAISSVRVKTGSSPAYTISLRPLPPQLPPGQSVRVAVDYTPTTPATDTGAVEIASDDCSRPLQTINLSATGIPANWPHCIPPKVFSPVTKWEYNSGPVASDYNVTWCAPIVVNVNDDNGDGLIDADDIPEVVISQCKPDVNMTNPDLTPPAVLRAINGRTGTTVWDMTDPGLALNCEAQIAAADIDGDNKVEIIGSLRYESPGTGTGGMQGKYKIGRLVAFENDGSFKWVSDFWNRSENEMEDGSSINIADLDADGVPEIIIGAAVYDNNGRMKWEGKGGMATTGHGVFSAVADLDGDGKLEVIGGNTIYSAEGTILYTFRGSDSVPIVIDVEGDGIPEIVLRPDAATIIVLDNHGVKKYGEWTLQNLPDSICGAPIAAADFDGDGKPELAIPAGNVFVVMKPATGQILWSHPINDYDGQCGAAGAAAFDFEGDGVFEAVYQDTIDVFAFRGTDGTVIYNGKRQSVTIWDTPAIADVDNDGHADIVTTGESNVFSHAPGVKLMNNVDNDWVATHRIWNQHNYHVTNIMESGAVPRVMKPPWREINGWRVAQPMCTH